jgi:hypothetical protein
MELSTFYSELLQLSPLEQLKRLRCRTRNKAFLFTYRTAKESAFSPLAVVNCDLSMTIKVFVLGGI